jgi:lipid-A-disaccharide synthase
MQKVTDIPKRVLIVAGESSGDLHGGNLIKAAKELHPGLDFYGVGGSRMRAAGCEILFPAEDLAVMGLLEVISHLPTIRNRFKRLESQLRGPEKPDLLLLIDYPGFNLRLAKVARDSGVPVLYYIAPKVWAWKKGRIKTIGERVDCLALIFPFEPPLYAAEDLQVRYVGNPLLDEYAAAQPLPDLRKQLTVAEGVPLIGIFPGSRRSELKYTLETLLESARLILEQKPDARFVLPVAPSLDPEPIRRRLEESQLPIGLSQESIYSVASACDAVLCVSGTVTLQTALCRTPMAVLYKAAQLSYLVGSWLVKIPHFSLVNIVAGCEVVREFLQHQANPQVLSDEVLRLLDDRDYRTRVIEGLEVVCDKLGEPGSSQRVALMAADICYRKA